VVQRGNRAGLALEPLQELRIDHELRRHRLQGHHPAEASVLGAVDHRHAAGAERSDDLVRAEAGTGGQVHVAVSGISTRRKAGGL
jgi:hypothetical protein